MTVIWCMVPQIWSAMDKIFCHFGLFFALLPPNNPKNQNFEKNEKISQEFYHFIHVYHKWQSYDVWFLRYWLQQTEFFIILDQFLPFYYPKNPKSQNFKKLKKTTGDIIILHKCTKNHDHTLYCSLDMTCNRPNCYFSFWAIFCLFVPLTARKIKINKKLNKTPQDIIILQ